MAACPFCERSSSLQFNIDSGLWLCFGCDERGSAKTLLRKLGQQYVEPELSVDILQERLDSYLEEAPEDTVLPESYLRRFAGPPHKAWRKRFNDSTIRKWQLGYDPLKNRLTIPYRLPTGELLGIIQRRIGSGFPRYIYPKGFERTTSLFGSWQVAKSRSSTIVVVEGSTDTIRLDQANFVSVAQFGSSIHPRQVQLLRRLGIEEIIFFYDYDAAGLKALRVAQERMPGFILSKVRYDRTKYCWHSPAECDCPRRHQPDPGSLSVDEIARMVTEAQLIGKQRRAWRRG